MSRASLKLLDIAREGLIEIVFVAEINHEHFVLGIAGTDQVQRRLIDLHSFFAHRAGIVDHNSHGNGNVLVPEGSDLLRLSIFKDGEGMTVERGDHALLVIDDNRVK